MGVSGRKPDLLAQRLGSGHREQPDAAGTGDAELPVSASGLPYPEELTPEARRVWQRLVPPLVDAQVLNASDVVMLTQLCETLAMAEEYRKLLYATMMDESSPVFDPGSPEEKRLRSGYVELLRVANSIASEYGISPTARIRLGLSKIKGASLLDSLDKRSGDAGRS